MQRGGSLALAAVLLASAACSAPRPTPTRADSGASHAPAASATPSPYVLGPEDVLTIAVWKEEGLSRQVRVRPDGKISFPLAGDVQAAGLTAAELQADLSRRLEQYVTAPAVSVTVDEVNSYKVFVLGEVERPGAVQSRQPITVLQALALAGGLKPFAKGHRIMLVRQVGGKTYRAPLSYRDIVLGRNGAVNVTLEPGDTLVVP
jgi:polysaccharide export outer membrane protein